MKRTYFFLSGIVLTIAFTCDLQSQFNDTLKIDYFGQTPPGMHAAVFAPDFISRENWFVQNCCFSPDGKEFVFVITDNNWAVSDVMYTKFSEGKWSEPVKIFDNALVPVFSYDGNKLYFISNQRNGSNDADIWVS